MPCTSLALPRGESGETRATWDRSAKVGRSFFPSAILSVFHADANKMAEGKKEFLRISCAFSRVK